MKNKSCVESNVEIEDTGFVYTLSLIGGKYKMIIIYKLYENSPFMRYNELKRSIGNISFKTLTSTLKELEEDNIIIRKEYPQIPPRVEYSLSKKGRTLIPILNMMCDWGEKNSI